MVILSFQVFHFSIILIPLVPIITALVARYMPPYVLLITVPFLITGNISTVGDGTPFDWVSNWAISRDFSFDEI